MIGDEFRDGFEAHAAGATELLIGGGRLCAIGAMHNQDVFRRKGAKAQRKSNVPNAFSAPLRLCVQKLSSKAGDHSFVNLSRHAYVVEIVLADEVEFTCLVEIEDFAALDV